MDSFCDPESQYFEIKMPTALELKGIKQMLLTGDRDQILQSVEKIKRFLNNEESLSIILRFDISEFLCDAVLPFDSVIVCTLYNCIEKLTEHVEFFSHNHSCFAIESLMRTLHFLMKDSGSLASLNQCLNLLNHIVQGYKACSITPEEKTVENLLQILPALMKNLPPTLTNKYQIGTLIFSLIQLDILKWSQKALEIIFTSFSSWFNLLNEILESEHQMREKLILLCSTLCHSALRYLLSNEDSYAKLNFEVNENLRNNLLKNISEFLINIEAPYLDVVLFNHIENDSSHLENFYQSILCFYNSDITIEKNRLIHGLSETGFLQFTTRIISLVDFSNSLKLRRIGVLVLFHTILCLAEEVFHFPEVWPNGRDDFRSEILHGIGQLPVDATQWLDILVDPQTSFSCKLALLLYLYFYSMTAKSQDMLQAIYPAVVKFIRSTSGIESSVFLSKVVWFVFVMSQLSIAQCTFLESEIEATNQMVSLLKAHADLSLIYTHHPALLYWAFSFKVNSSIQTQTVYLWLRNKTADCRELDELIKRSSDARFAILDILQNGWGQELNSAFTSLKTLIVNFDDDDLAASIWFLLPQVLAKFTTDSTPVTNVDYVIELCSLRTPQSWKITRIIRIASLLPEVLLKSDLISMLPSLSLVFQLMQLGLKMEDHRVLSIFLRHNGFVLKIMEGLNAKVSDISIISTKIMILLWKECKEIKKLEKYKKIGISKETMLKLLETDCEQALSKILDFLQQILLSSFQSPIFEIRDVDKAFIETLFFQIQNACIKAAPEICKKCWRCLMLFLTIEPMEDKSLQYELVTSPLLFELIFLFLPSLKDLQELKNFLMIWIEFYNAKFKDPCFGRKIFGTFYSEIVRKVGKKLMEDYRQKDTVLFEKIFQSGFFCYENLEEKELNAHS